MLGVRVRVRFRVRIRIRVNLCLPKAVTGLVVNRWLRGSRHVFHQHLDAGTASGCCYGCLAGASCAWCHMQFLCSVCRSCVQKLLQCERQALPFARSLIPACCSEAGDPAAVLAYKRSHRAARKNWGIPPDFANPVRPLSASLAAAYKIQLLLCMSVLWNMVHAASSRELSCGTRTREPLCFASSGQSGKVRHRLLW